MNYCNFRRGLDADSLFSENSKNLDPFLIGGSVLAAFIRRVVRWLRNSEYNLFYVRDPLLQKKNSMDLSFAFRLFCKHGGLGRLSVGVYMIDRNRERGLLHRASETYFIDSLLRLV